MSLLIDLLQAIGSETLAVHNTGGHWHEYETCQPLRLGGTHRRFDTSERWCHPRVDIPIDGPPRRSGWQVSYSCQCPPVLWTARFRNPMACRRSINKLIGLPEYSFQPIALPIRSLPGAGRQRE